MEPLKKFSSFNPAKGAFTLLDEFKGFIFRGNVIDLAIGVIIAGAFGKIIDSFVKNIILPVVGLFLPSQQGYLGWKFVIRGKEIPYGLFIGEAVNFIVVAAVLFFFLVKFLSFLMRTKKAEAAANPLPTKDQMLLTEIRDLLKNRNA